MTEPYEMTENGQQWKSNNNPAFEPSPPSTPRTSTNPRQRAQQHNDMPSDVTITRNEHATPFLLNVFHPLEVIRHIPVITEARRGQYIAHLFRISVFMITILLRHLQRGVFGAETDKNKRDAYVSIFIGNLEEPTMNPSILRIIEPPVPTIEDDYYNKPINDGSETTYINLVHKMIATSEVLKPLSKESVLDLLKNYIRFFELLLDYMTKQGISLYVFRE